MPVAEKVLVCLSSSTIPHPYAQFRLKTIAATDFEYIDFLNSNDSFYALAATGTMPRLGVEVTNHLVLPKIAVFTHFPMHSTPKYPHDCLDAQRRSLEVLVNQPKAVSLVKVRLQQALTVLGRGFVNHFAATAEPRIYSRQRGGKTVWHAYDPITQRRQQFSSEEALRCWLDQRYYQ